MKNDIKILIVEDDGDINNLLREMLLNEGYKVESAYSGTEALMYIKQGEYEIVLLDLMIPGKSGEEVLGCIRESHKMPVLIISAKEEEGIKSALLRAGADDFITKPFDIDEVLARIEVNIRRYVESSKYNEDTSIRVYKEISLYKDRREVTVNGNNVSLTVREFSILELLISHPRKVFSKANLFKSVWGEDYICDDNTITVHISNLKGKLHKAGAEHEYIKTVWGIGYKFDIN